MLPLPPESTATFPSRDHDHGRCVAAALGYARAVCRTRGTRLTELRRRVLELVWQSHQPLGAYAILEMLRTDGRSAAPPTVYRALDFLQENGLVHRLASLNAYVGCREPGGNHAGQFLICAVCGVAAEINDPAIARAVEHSARAAGFRVATPSIEVTGLCPACDREAGDQGV